MALKSLILLKFTIIAILIIFFFSILEVCLIGYPNQLHMVITQEVGETMLKLTKTKYLQEQKWFNIDRKNHPFPCFKNSSLTHSSVLCIRSISKFSAFILNQILVIFISYIISMNKKWNLKYQEAIDVISKNHNLLYISLSHPIFFLKFWKINQLITSLLFLGYWILK